MHGHLHLHAFGANIKGWYITFIAPTYGHIHTHACEDPDLDPCCVLEGDAEAASRRARLTALSVLANFAGNLEASMTAWLELLARLSLDMPD